MSKLRNDAVEQYVLEPASCHCTYRELDSPTTATAYCNESGTVRAKISWTHHSNRTVISWTLPHGYTYNRIFQADAETMQIRARILDGFVEMHTSWAS